MRVEDILKVIKSLRELKLEIPEEMELECIKSLVEIPKNNDELVYW